MFFQNLCFPMENFSIPFLTIFEIAPLKPLKKEDGVYIQTTCFYKKINFYKYFWEIWQHEKMIFPVEKMKAYPITSSGEKFKIVTSNQIGSTF